MTSGHCLVLFLVTLFLSSIEIITGQDPEVRSPAGTFRGKVLTAPSGARYESYRGIPYALPPTGERRFAVPEPYPVIEGEYDATDFGPFCVQQVSRTTAGQEDCLYLNVFTPLKPEDTTAESRLKSVYVFIHGGGLVMGYSNVYVPGDLVSRADIVVVTMNYRLGLLGFLHGNSDSLPGNQGYWDQLLALRWVKDNIRAFGGNPDDVTLSGESAGSISTSVLSISPLGKDLFNKALLLSANAFFFFPSPARTSNFLLEKAAETFACGVKTVAGNEEDVVTCLKEQPAESFALNFAVQLFDQFTSSGDDLLPRPIPEILDDSEYLSKVGFFSRDYIVSCTNDDGYILINSYFGQVNTTSVDSAARKLANALRTTEYLVRLLLPEYQKIYGGLEKSAIALGTDNLFIKQSLRFLEVYENNSDRERSSKNAYIMSFDHRPRYMQNQYMIHALDLAYLFDIEPKQMEMFYLIKVEEGFYDEDKQLKSDFIDLIGSFVKTGNPNYSLEKRNIVWPPFDTDKKSYLSFSLYPSVREDILANRRYIWDTLVPKWIQESQVQKGKQEL